MKKEMMDELKTKIMDAVEMAIADCMGEDSAEVSEEYEDDYEDEPMMDDKEKRKAAVIIGFKK